MDLLQDVYQELPYALPGDDAQRLHCLRHSLLTGLVLQTLPTYLQRDLNQKGENLY